MDTAFLAYKGAKQILGKLAVLTFLQSLMIITQAYFLADAISSFFRGDLFRTVVTKLLIFFTAMFLRQIITSFKKTISFHFAAVTSEGRRKDLLDKLFELGPRFVSEEGSGQTVTLVMEGITRFRRYLEIIPIKFVNMAIVPASILLFIFYFNTRSAVILIVALPILVIFMILLGLAAKSKADRQYEDYQLLSNHFVDSLRGIETLRYLGLSKQHDKKIALVSEKYRQATMGTLKVAFLSSFALDFFTMLSIATVAVFLGIALINGGVDLHTSLTILILAPEYFLPVRELGADYHSTLDGKNAGAKIEQILAQKSLLKNQEAIPLWNSDSSLEIKEVSLKYHVHHQAALQNITLSVSGAKKVGIIGTSGAGKTTLIELLSGFLSPTSGEFYVNDKKLTSLSNMDWQSQVSFIPQHPYVFNDSILNNIRFYCPEAAAEEAIKAAEKAGLLEIIQSFPDGIETIIGDGGRTLSGGQEQRIALARTFLGSRPIIMLDEPTAHLDIETEHEIKETMLDLFENKLVFFATHRLHWMLDMDEIIVVEQGQIIEKGTHQQLMNNQLAYYQLVKAQEVKG
jgi:ATP-binding cassette, subfamily C, bacterial CydD